MNPEEIFHAALAKAQAERSDFLHEACAGDETLRQRVEALLRAHENPGSFLADRPAATAAFDEPIRERPGAVIGAYKLVEQIGEGGMGTVWMAQQQEPVKRVVALKLIKAGMDSKQVIARFEAERQALALMDHPNIAKVLDGGVTSDKWQVTSEKQGDDSSLVPRHSSLVTSSRPYFVMELIKGVPITKYCDEHRLTPRQRLELFIPVCQAVQHAHQKGIIHRDLKPSNVLVALYDGKPVPKVIDFGVAKAAGQPLTEQTLVTGFGAIVGTLEYMSPEQAEVNQLDIDTRSDIYSLGVLLYELLTGGPPFTRKELEKAGMLEMLRVIREQEPSKPSTKLSTAEGLPTLAANRGMEPAKLTKLVRGELDWIVMKALEKERNRRYETANGFAMDVQRYLADEPVLAGPPSAWYRLRKFVRRNRRVLAMATVLCLALLVGLGAVAVSVGWVMRDQEARQTRLAGEVDSILNEAEQLTRKQRWPEALVVAKRAEAALAAGDANQATETRVRQALADLQLMERLEAARLLESQLVEGELDHARAERAYAEAFAAAGVKADELAIGPTAEQLRSRTWIASGLATALTDWARLRRLQMADDDPSWRALLALAEAIDSDPWRRRLRTVCRTEDFSAKTLRELAEAASLEDLPPSAVVLLGRMLQQYVSANEAVALLQKAQERHPDDFWINFDLGVYHTRSTPPRPEHAVTFFRVALALRPEYSAVLSNLAAALDDQGQLDEAIRYSQRAIRVHPRDPYAHNCLGLVYRKLNKSDDAIASFEKALEINRAFVPAIYNLGQVFADRNQLDRAIEYYNRAIALAPKKALAHASLGEALRRKGLKNDAITAFQTALEIDPRNAVAHNNLGLTYADLREWDKAIEHYKQAIAINPSNAIAHTNIGAALGNQGNWSAAADWHRKAIKLDPRLVPAHFNLGESLRNLDDLDGAMDSWNEALRIDADYVPALSELGVALANRGNLDAAIDCFAKAHKFNPTHATIRRNFALALYTRAGKRVEKGDIVAAICALREVVTLTPDDAMALNDLAWCLAAGPDPAIWNPKEAVVHARRAVQLDPEPWRHWATLSVAAFRAGEWKESLAARKEKNKRRPIDVDDKLFLAMTHWQLGDHPEARRWFEEGAAELDRTETPSDRLRSLRREAGELLKLEKPAPPRK